MILAVFHHARPPCFYLVFFVFMRRNQAGGVLLQVVGHPTVVSHISFHRSPRNFEVHSSHDAGEENIFVWNGTDERISQDQLGHRFSRNNVAGAVGVVWVKRMWVDENGDRPLVEESPSGTTERTNGTTWWEKE